MIIGLTGPNAAGKGEVASRLRQHGFRIHSLSDVVREVAAACGLPAEREHLIRIGTELRRDHGPGVLAQRISERLGDRDVVDSIRNPVEVEELRSVRGFLLLGVGAPQRVRFERSMQRARPGDPQSLGEFRRREAQENTADPAAQRLDATFTLADRILTNDDGIDALHLAVDRLLAELEAA